VEEEQSNETDDEVELTPPAGKTGFEHTNDMKKKVQKETSGATSSTNRQTDRMRNQSILKTGY